jgi:hypothetical protein
VLWNIVTAFFNGLRSQPILSQWWPLASLAVNLGFAYRWTMNRVRMDRFLQGHWQGKLFRENLTTNLVYEVDMYLTNHSTQQVSGVVVYQVRDLDKDVTVSKGVDQLVTYRRNPWFALNRQWAPRFARQFHVHHEPDDIRESTDKKIYDYTCRATSWMSKPCFDVRVTTGGTLWQGQLQKLAS